MNSTPTHPSSSGTLVDGVAATLRRLEHEAQRDLAGGTSASRRLATFQKSLTRALQAAHLETLEEVALV